ncbi:TerB family tellurite resistance protein [Yoonia sp. F2084L]|uniref:tellurite resistance TerB family protein n=1 Tax=Yoonia sp. F2084L TaxID=2926419 RepID=UPI001FF1BC99|nr:DUF533 domain-containing protein [Yoonia sp. F2084L]MCK0094030.1 TerB family tellurite resistance protein [Yoonia sp. F2084L]
MRTLFIGLFAAFLTTTMATQAEARGSYSTTQSMLFVSQTELTDDAGPLALCHLVTTNAVIFVNVWRTLDGYALASGNCQTDQYYEFTGNELLAAQAAGMIPEGIPAAPKLALGKMAEGFWGLGALVALLAVIGAKALMVKRRTSQRMAMVSHASPAAKSILDAMCHAAKADGYVAPSEVEMIQRAAQEMTGEAISLELVQQMAQLAEEKVEAKGFLRLVNGRNKLEQLDMMRAVLMVVASDGRLDGREKAFVGGLAQAMKMDGGTVSALLQEAVSGGAGQPAPA